MISTPHPKFPKPCPYRGHGTMAKNVTHVTVIVFLTPHNSRGSEKGKNKKWWLLWLLVSHLFFSGLTKEEKKKISNSRFLFLHNNFISLHTVHRHPTFSLLLRHTNPFIHSFLHPIFHILWHYCVGLQACLSSATWGCYCRLPWWLSDSAPWTQISQGPPRAGLRCWVRSLCGGKRSDFSSLSGEANSLEGQEDPSPVKRDMQGERPRPLCGVWCGSQSWAHLREDSSSIALVQGLAK